LSPTKSLILSTEPHRVLDVIDGWKKSVDTLEQQAETYKRYVERPGGSYWEGATAEAAQNRAAQDYRAVVAAHDTVFSRAGQIANAVSSSLIPPLNNAKQIIANAEQVPGATVNEDLSITYTAPDATSPNTAEADKNAVAAAEAELKAAADKWWAAENAVAQQIRDAEGAVGKDLNFGAALADIGKAFGDRREILSEPLPDDPKQFADMWNQLTPEEKDSLYSQDHEIGNHPGMPWDPTDHLGKDHYNRLRLPELVQQTQADVDETQRSIDDMTHGHNVDDGALYALQTQLAVAQNHLQGYKAAEAELNSTDGPKRYLGQIDEFGHAAISINNPDTAKRNAILVPGTGQDLTTIGGADNKSLRMYNAALQADRSLGPQDVAVTTWMGYDRPMDLGQADFPDPARAGASNLDVFEAGQRASHVGAASIDTVIGHSYGSTMVGAAASGGHQLDADNIIAVGSPGMLVDRASDLSLDPGGHVYAMRAENDIIGLAGLATQWTLGYEPDTPQFGAIHLDADPGPAGPLSSPSIAAHSSYWDPGNKALLNMGSVIAGTPPPFPYVYGRR
jgi:Alpha/beta hydrolase